MQRSPKSLFAKCLSRPQRRLECVYGCWRDLCRSFASKSSGGSGRSGSGNRRDSAANIGLSRTGRGDNQKGTLPAGRTNSVQSITNDLTRRYFARQPNMGDLQRRINREDNMWRDRGYVDTKWLNPRDPFAYRPNFRPTEPISLRKQFMRSPDEISREVMSRDWEQAVLAYRNAIMNGEAPPAGNKAWEFTDNTRQYFDKRKAELLNQKRQEQAPRETSEKEQLENPQQLLWAKPRYRE